RIDARKEESDDRATGQFEGEATARLSFPPDNWNVGCDCGRSLAHCVRIRSSSDNWAGFSHRSIVLASYRHALLPRAGNNRPHSRLVARLVAPSSLHAVDLGASRLDLVPRPDRGTHAHA